MQETELYEELVQVDESLDVTLHNSTPTTIEIIGRGSIRKDILDKILKIVNKRNAELKLESYGVLRIYFKEDE